MSFPDGTPPDPPPAPDPHSPPGPSGPGWRRGLALALLVVVVTVLGALVGWVWAGVAPRVPVIKVNGGIIYEASVSGTADSEPEQPIAADGWFLLLGAATGAVCAVGAWILLRRHRGVGVLAGLTVGSLLGACVAWWVGHKIGTTEFAHVNSSAAIGARLDAPLGLRSTNLNPRRWWLPEATGVAAVQALVAVFVYTLLAGFSADDTLRRSRRDQLTPGLAGSSDGATGTART